MTNNAVSRFATVVGLLGTFCMILGFLGAMMSASGGFIALGAVGLVAVGICWLL